MDLYGAQVAASGRTKPGRLSLGPCALRCLLAVSTAAQVTSEVRIPGGRDLEPLTLTLRVLRSPVKRRGIRREQLNGART